MTKPRRVSGAKAADPTKLSLAALPFELQALVLEAAVEPQVIFMDVVENVLKFTPPADAALGLACRLSREVYTKNKALHKFGDQTFWLDPDHDIFYLRTDDPVPRVPRPSPDPRLPAIDGVNLKTIRNVAVDLPYLGSHPHLDSVFRILALFPHLTTLHVLVPKGPPGTLPARSTPETLVLSKMPHTQVVAAPGGHDKELFLAVRYQVRKVCARILDIENGRRLLPEVVGHLASLRDGTVVQQQEEQKQLQEEQLQSQDQQQQQQQQQEEQPQQEQQSEDQQQQEQQQPQPQQLDNTDNTDNDER
jgi:hypothetical protein